MKTVADKIVNAVLFPFGRCRIKIEEDSPISLESILAVIKQKGGVRDGDRGLPGFDEWYFRLPGGRIKLTVIEYGEMYLWGPKHLIREFVSQFCS